MQTHQQSRSTTLFNRGLSLAARCRPSEAIDCFARALAGSPRFAEASHNLGLMLHSLDRHGEAVEPLRNAIAWKPDYDAARFVLGRVLFALKRYREAEICWRTVIALDPSRATPYVSLGTALAKSERNGTAIPLFRRAIAIDPGNADGHYGLGNSLAAIGQNGEAVHHLAIAAELAPASDAVRNNLAIALQALGRFDEARRACRDAVALAPAGFETYSNLGSILQALDRTEEAETCYDRALTLAPGFAEAHYNRGVCLLESGRLGEASEAFAKAIELAPKRGVFHRMLAESFPVDANGPHFRRMEALARTIDELPDDDRMELHFALGKAYEDTARHREAFHHLLAGNRLKRATFTYDEAEALESLRSLPGVFTAEWLAKEPENAISSRLPVFIVGMPRSGTTLVEQILASHPKAFGAGEVLDLERLTDDLCGPDFSDLSPRALHRLGAAYLDRLSPHARTAERIVDKLPGNFQRIGIIRKALPGARIIHVRRDPVDTCLSCFSKLFTDKQLFAYDLAELGRYWRAYDRLMSHWRRVLPPGVMLEVRYEDMVADMEGQARRLLAHCGLAWDARCLAFHRTDRVVRTASVTQVRQPLYRTAVGRWHVFGDLAQPLIDALG
ncbi:tetratricopeptide repeat-containing sulfotransferase family protein [Telmatospirillum siberiense]|uniref:tetratricopeptide repeat-containing sulfotransferase family protein n=1 Tax=Telmatospirillum siberiense TaxID=382514 RepID=UPI0011AF5D4E|nr:sulfotransferase [Telmatospirillum siberiense]